MGATLPTPDVGDATFIDLQTTQCTFNPSTVTPCLAACFKQAAGIMSATGLALWLQFGELLWWFFSAVQNLAVGYASWTAPISIGTVSPHGLSTGQRAILAGILGNTAANGGWPITVTDASHFTLNGSSGNGNYVAGTGTCSGGGMAYYGAYTAQAAHTALGRFLAAFYTQDDDPTINGSADANFLASLIKSHIDLIRTAVLASYPGAKFELLWPYDVNFATCYYTPDIEFKFILYKHGPFSFDLRDEIGWMRSTRLLEWEVRSNFYGPSLRSGQLSATLKRQFPVMPHRYSSQIDFVAQRFGGKNVAALERLTTAIYVTVDENTPRQDRYINELKPHVSIPEAVAALVEADALIQAANDEFPPAMTA